ncbi:unnamed protein product [Pleuronectes platessa]|uniref:Uncharacterized protein n=1 Tax=Pleuronectes platessa TaxID=8262 RepID=A0A9N7TME2_PLEPL|nr:unnamed protein product [Pleuronectes platessa]
MPCSGVLWVGKRLLEPRSHLDPPSWLLLLLRVPEHCALDAALRLLRLFANRVYARSRSAKDPGGYNFPIV